MPITLATDPAPRDGMCVGIHHGSMISAPEGTEKYFFADTNYDAMQRDGDGYLVASHLPSNGEKILSGESEHGLIYVPHDYATVGETVTVTRYRDGICIVSVTGIAITEAFSGNNTIGSYFCLDKADRLC